MRERITALQALAEQLERERSERRPGAETLQESGERFRNTFEQTQALQTHLAQTVQKGHKTMNQFDAIMTVDEVAQYLSLHPLTVRRLARDGEIPALKIGRQWRFKQSLLDLWIGNKSMQNVHISPE